MKKRFITFFLLLSLSLLAAACSPASADVITAMAIDVNPQHLEKTASYARILGYNEENDTLTVELMAQEIFPADLIAALRPGDSIFSGGREVEIQSIDYSDETCAAVFINGDEVILFQNRSGNYTAMAEEDDYVWNSVAVIECPVRPSLLFLDFIDDQTGNEIPLPVVHSSGELVKELQLNHPANW